MKYVIIIVRILLGLMFAVFGSNGFLHFIAMPPMQGQAGAFIGALISSGYIYAIAAIQVLGGLLLLIGRFVPLGLTLLGPVIVNVFPKRPTYPDYTSQSQQFDGRLGEPSLPEMARISISLPSCARTFG